MAKAKSSRLAEVLSLLNKSAGRTPSIKSDLPLDLLVGLILCRHGSPLNASRAVAALREEFVDFNEVRISYVREIVRPLKAHGFPNAPELARGLIDLFTKFYKDHNAVNLDFLERMEPDAAYRYLSEIEFVGPAAAAGIVASRLEDGQAIAVADVLRVPGRLGLAGKSATPTKVRKFLEEYATGADRVRAHYLLTRHATEVCVSRNPLCPECVLIGVCEYARAAGAVPARKKPATTKAAAKKKPAAKKRDAARKKPVAKKKPAAGKKAAAKKDPATGKKQAAKKPAAKKKPAKKPAKKK